MHTQRLPSVSIGLHGSLWISMDHHSSPWMCMGLHGRCLFSIQLHRYPCIMHLHRYLFIYVDRHGCPRIVLYGDPITCMNIPRPPWISIDFHGSPLICMDLSFFMAINQFEYISMDFQGLWMFINLHSSSTILVIFLHEGPSICMDVDRTPSTSIVFHGTPWSPWDLQEPWWTSMDVHEYPSFSIDLRRSPSMTIDEVTCISDDCVWSRWISIHLYWASLEISMDGLDVDESPYMSMDVDESWIFTDLRSSPWIVMNTYGSFNQIAGISEDLHWLLWISLNLHRSLWISIDVHGSLFMELD